jgi:tight adherence protein B
MFPPTMPAALMVAALVGAGLVLAGMAHRRWAADRRLAAILGLDDRGGGWIRTALSNRTLVLRLEQIVAAIVGAAAGTSLLGPVGLVAGVLAGALVPAYLRRRGRRRRDVLLEGQLADVVEATSLGVRSGLSIRQALEFAAGEIPVPMAPYLGRLLAEQCVGAPLEDALKGFAGQLDSDDARLFVLILSVHARSGGNLAGALNEVAATIHHRVEVRRELRALTAQGRISGAILGTLPIGFFLVLAAVSHHDLEPVYRSSAGVAMIAAGLVLEGLAYVWIRRLLRVPI